MRFSVRLAGRMRFSVRRALGERAKVRFSVRSNVQNALFREGVVPECTFSHLRKRGVASRKGALCNLDLTEKRTLSWSLTKRRTLRASGHPDCAFT